MAEEAGTRPQGKLDLEIITPISLLYAGPADEVNAPGSLGRLGILPGHDPIMVTLIVAPLTYRLGERTHVLYCGGGFMEVNDDKVRVLAEVAERADQIDRERAEAARKRAEERMARSASDPNIDFARAEAALRRALTRLEVSAEK